MSSGDFTWFTLLILETMLSLVNESVDALGFLFEMLLGSLPILHQDEVLRLTLALPRTDALPLVIGIGLQVEVAFHIELRLRLHVLWSVVPIIAILLQIVCSLDTLTITRHCVLCTIFEQLA